MKTAVSAIQNVIREHVVLHHKSISAPMALWYEPQLPNSLVSNPYFGMRLNTIGLSKGLKAVDTEINHYWLSAFSSKAKLDRNQNSAPETTKHWKDLMYTNAGNKHGALNHKC